MTKIILTSDDFGLSQIYNEKMIEMLQLGYLTSISVMVKRISEKQISQVQTLIDIYKNKKISIGLHLELSELDYLNNIDEQWLLFETIFGFYPNYLDLHKDDRFKGDFNEIAKICNSKKLPFRKYSSTNIFVNAPTNSIIATYININEIKNLIDNFEKNKIHELIFHIGNYDSCVKSKLNKEREIDCEKLIQTHEYLKIKGYGLTNYSQIQIQQVNN